MEGYLWTEYETTLTSRLKTWSRNGRMWLAIAISLLGAAVTTGGILATRLCDSWTQRNIDLFISFAAGVLIAVSFLHLGPEALGL